MDRDNIEMLLGRYLEGGASVEEIILVEKWLEANNLTNPLWDKLNSTEKEQWLSTLFESIETSIETNETKVVKIRKWNMLWRSIAASIIVITFMVYFGKSLFYNSPPPLTTLTASTNQKRELRLADGSKVWINSESQLKYPQIFNGDSREVYLSGEAYFDIKHDAAKPFIIHTGSVITTVLGTAFNIKEDKTKKTIAVTVTRGRVSVANGDQQLGVITPNQQISINLQDIKVVKRKVDAERVIAWQLGDLHFDDITFAEAAVKLEHRFNVTIDFANEHLKDCRFSGTALTGDKLDKILKVVCTFNKATYKVRSDGSVMIEGTGCY